MSLQLVGRHVALRYTRFSCGHTGSHMDQIWSIKYAQETRDLTPADTAMSVTVHMSLTSTKIEIF
jgi:hypothetical protein